jgi:hypothetical protein
MIHAYELLVRTRYPGNEDIFNAIGAHLKREASEGKIKTTFEVPLERSDLCRLNSSELIRSFLIAQKYLVKIVETKESTEVIEISWS